MSSLMSQIKGRCTFFFLLLKSKLGSRNENKLDIFKITLPNINFEAFNHQDKVDGGVNGGVNNGLDDWISEIVIKFADSRDADIIQAIGKDPDIKMKELVNISVLKYPKMNSNIISKRIQIHSHLKFKGAPKAYQAGQTSNRTINQVAFPLSFSWYIMAQSLIWLMLITKAIGKYPMNGYSVVKEQRIFQKKDPSLYLPLSEGSDNR